LEKTPEIKKLHNS